MKKTLLLSGLVLIITAFRLTGWVAPATDEIQPAIQSSLNLLQKSSNQFIENAGCFSCHGQSLGLIAFAYGKQRGFDIEDSTYESDEKIMYRAFTRRQVYMIEHTELLGGDISTSYVLWSFGIANRQPDKTTDFMVRQLLERQVKDGHWVGNNSRPPLEYYSFSATAMALYGLNKYARPGFVERITKARQKAVDWLSKTDPVNNEEKVFQLLGLTWAKSDSVFVRNQGVKLLKLQHANGGWSQLDSLGTDAYATGQSLFALEESGTIDINDPAYQRGVAYLLSTQNKDGSWKIISRSHPFLPHVSSGFPYGPDQFISAAGTSWATIALLQAVPKMY